jgi:protein SCO1/2
MKFKILRNPFLWAFLIGIASLHLIKHLALMQRRAPAPMIEVKDWQLIDQDGKSFGKEDLRGKLVVANFFFTSCPSICPMLTHAMKEIYQRFKDKPDAVHFVSITVDPETDTPQLLKKFMQENGMDHENWHCLTGSKRDIFEVIVEKMRVHVGEKEAIHGVPDSYDIPHLAHLALFDQRGDLRGLFKTENVELAALVRATNFLLEKN